jgi:hypothetical protein
LAEKNNLVCLSRADLDVSQKERNENGKYPSHYVVMARRPADLDHLSKNPLWYRPTAPPGTPVWTDDYSNIISVLNW